MTQSCQGARLRKHDRPINFRGMIHFSLPWQLDHIKDRDTIQVRGDLIHPAPLVTVAGNLQEQPRTRFHAPPQSIAEAFHLSPYMLESGCKSSQARREPRKLLKINIHRD
jgi:hypothetical protein